MNKCQEGWSALGRLLVETHKSGFSNCCYYQSTFEIQPVTKELDFLIRPSSRYLCSESCQQEYQLVPMSIPRKEYRWSKLLRIVDPHPTVVGQVSRLCTLGITDPISNALNSSWRMIRGSVSFSGSDVSYFSKDSRYVGEVKTGFSRLICPIQIEFTYYEACLASPLPQKFILLPGDA
jgi:hypothetical protein